MSARLARSLPQVNRHIFARLSSRARPLTNVRHAGLARNAWNRAPLARVTQPNVARFAHTDAGAARPGTAILDATGYKGSTVTEKHWTSQDLPIVDALIEPRAILHFIGFITQGWLPNGKKTDLPLVDQDEFPLFMTPSSQWAPAPSNQSTTPIVEKAMARISGTEDLSGLCQVGQNIHFLKSRLWGGLDPVPESQWREKDLNNLENFAIAHEYLTSVIAVFEYLNIPQIRTNMRDTFNKISGDFEEMQNALNARRRAQGSTSPDINLTALWEQFIRAQYEVITSTAHSWILARTAEVREPILSSLSAIPNENHQLPESKALMQKWGDLMAVNSMADFTIWIPMDGYNGYQAPSEIVAGLHNPDLASQDKDYGFAELLMSQLTKVIETQNEAAKVEGPSAVQSEAARRERFSVSTVVQDQLREKIRGQTPSPQPPVQPWIQQLLRGQEDILAMAPKEREDLGFGLAIYRAAHKFSDEEWETFKQRLESHLSAWGEGLQRADELKPLLKLHWFDCQELGFETTKSIPEARRHFQGLQALDEWSYKLAPSVFLVADSMGVASYIEDGIYASYKKDKGLLDGDFQGHVLAIDPNFDESTLANESGSEKTEDSQDKVLQYPGQMRIHGNLVWSELYPMLMLQSVRLENLWLQAREHPVKMYTGMTVPSQLEPWREWNSLKGVMMDGFMDFLKKKDPSLAGNLQDMRKKGSI
ncbi:unnamed protein product [Penicillium olsonii]|nr:unnamed protein product [Penicillium olsonii]CAG7932064.1 unnamed protein product [Penicillium olsonii]